MFKNFYADAYFKNIKEVSPEFLKEKGIEGIILDIDNTLIGHDVPVPDDEMMAHLRLYEAEGFKLCVVSNNTYERVKAFTEKIDVEFFVYKALKPKSFGYEKASRQMNIPLNKIAAVGDQVFTDVWGAKRAGCFAILTKPLHEGGEGKFIAFKRLLEKPFTKKFPD